MSVEKSTLKKVPLKTTQPVLVELLWVGFLERRAIMLFPSVASPFFPEYNCSYNLKLTRLYSISGLCLLYDEHARVREETRKIKTLF